MGASGGAAGEPEEIASSLELTEAIRKTAELFAVLSDPTRVRIIHALSQADLCVGDLAKIAGVSASAVSHQLRILRGMGLVDYRREKRKTIYSLSDEHLQRILEQGLMHAKETG